MDQGYLAIGRAVAAAQIFETALVPIVELSRMVADPAYRDETRGYVRAGKFKVPITSIVNTLTERGDIASDLATRLSEYAENRHTLIHRWVQKYGWPADDDAAGWAPIIELANRVNAEATLLTKLLVGYVVKFADANWAAHNRDEYIKRMALLFHQAHLEQ
jgi:hypothetical protein